MRTSHLLAVSATVLLLSLTACSGGSDGDSTEAVSAMDGGAAGGSAGDMARESAPEAPADAAGANKSGVASNAVDLTTQQALIKTGAVSLRSADVGRTRYDVQVLVDEQGGQVADDKTETDKSGEPLRARMVLRVPVDSFEDVMNALGSMETLASTSTSSEDVTTQLIDVEARIKAQQASVERVRQLLAQARSIRDIMAIESELAQRQAELDSLAQQQAYLEDQTSMATVKVNIERKPDPKAPVTEDDDSGFLAGLAAGWDGLKTTVVAVATVVGAVLPFAVVVLLLAVPVWLLVRRTRRTPVASTPAAAPGGE
ncbi:MAG TPA: DUF4349 domain-containing protein [Nocardioides sp.]|nr:DUF4349 domain-containing protein [Nocardioides sp.]